MPERAPTGQLPRSIQVVLENDLVDKVKPGDRVSVQGVFRALPPSAFGNNGTFRKMLVATGIQNLLADKEKPSMSETDIKNIRKLAKDEKVFDTLASSVAASIEGMQHVKKAILL